MDSSARPNIVEQFSRSREYFVAPPAQLRSLFRDRRSWLTAAMLVLVGLLYYGYYLDLHEWLPAGGSLFVPDFPHDLHRALFLIPMLYAAISFRVRGALGVVLISTCIMVPYTWLASPFAYSLIRTLAFVFTSGTAAVLLGVAEERRIRIKRETGFITALVETAAALIIVLDKDGRIVLFNNACQRTTGYSLEEVLGKKIWDLFLLAEEREAVRQVFGKLTGGSVRSEFENYWLTKGGDKRRISWSNASLLDEQGETRYILATGIDVTRQRKAEDNIRTYAELLTEAHENERKRIARELHDETAQELARLALDIDLLISSPKLLQKASDMVERLEEFRKKTDSILQGVRRFSQDLRPPVLEDFGLIVALQWIAEELNVHYMLNVTVGVTGTPRRIMPNTELVLFRIAQEALNNVRKHAKATRVDVNLAFLPDSVRLTVVDNGQGFKMPEDRGEFVPMGKLGLLGMYERSRLIDGQFLLESDIGKGTTVDVIVSE